MYNPENLQSLVLSTSRALWHEIRPNMRQISVEYNKDTNTVILYFFLDKPQTQEELNYDVVGTIICEVSADFPQVQNWEDKVMIVPYPNTIPEEGIVVFRRYEPPSK